MNNFGDTRSGGLAGPMGLFIIVLMSIATVLLIRNMNKRLRRLPDSFPDSRAIARDAEVARLEADLARQEGRPASGGADGDRSGVDGSGAAAEVAGVESTDGVAKDGGRGERA
ncbi:hypothetical protein Ahu01nite_088900 [Winogradskya humida]|uniref:Preprotein translocase subunit TatA n=1 Tax=Winogradskya humida TaxID=113566 RepID=A0ABQ4A4K3_9ACTN|nr:hypothetical protein Ahu01nite_088900 [Actinoplanes humidus]